jgi:hypothetical protein
MRRAGLLFLLTVLLGGLTFVVIGALRQSDDAFTLNVPVLGAVTEVPPGSTFCQNPIDVPIGGAFDGGRLTLGTERRRGPELAVRLEDVRGRKLAAATVAGGYADNSTVRFELDRTIESGRGLRLCVTNVGDVRVLPYGSGGDPNPSIAFTVDDRPLAVDAAIVFERPSRSTLAAVGDILERATLFRTPRLSAALYGALLLLLLAAATVAGTLALRAAEREDDASGFEREPRR